LSKDRRTDNEVGKDGAAALLFHDGIETPSAQKGKRAHCQRRTGLFALYHLAFAVRKDLLTDVLRKIDNIQKQKL
jgi:hypothetical protein